MAESEQAAETIWQLEQLISGLKGILTASNLLLVKAAFNERAL